MIENVPNRSTTERGFSVYDSFVDRDDRRVDVIESSLATEDCLRIYVTPSISLEYGSIHLTVDMATRVRNAINSWLEEKKCND